MPLFSQDLREILLTALRMPEYRDELISIVETLRTDVDSLELTGTGDINSDGSVPFAADQSMGGNTLTNVEDPINDQDAATKNYVDDEIDAIPATPPGGIDTQVQFNDGGSTFGGDTAFTWDKTNEILNIGDSFISETETLASWAAPAAGFFNDSATLPAGFIFGTTDLAGARPKDVAVVAGSATSGAFAGADLYLLGGASTADAGGDIFAIAGVGGDTSGSININTTADYVAPAAGQIKITSSGHLILSNGTGTATFNGSSLEISGFTSISAGAPITNVTNPTNAQDAATKNYVDTEIGALDFANPTLNNLDSPTAINQNLLPDTDDSKSLGTSGVGGKSWSNLVINHISGPNGDQTSDIDIFSNLVFGNLGTTAKITGLPTPTVASDAATKDYVDTSAGYTVANDTHWVDPNPTTVQAALDRLAAVVSTGGATPIP